MARIEREIGGAGTGKTRLIEKKLTQAREELGLSHDEVGLCTFTRAGRQELSERVAASWGVDVDALTKHGWFRTAHSIAFKQTRVEEGSLIEGKDGAEWVSGVLGCRVTAKYDVGSGDSSFTASDEDTDAGLALKAWELARQRMVPLKTVIHEWSLSGDDAPQLATATKIISTFERAKRREGRIDFTDLVARFGGVNCTIDGPQDCDPIGEIPETLKVLAIDEAQDSSALVDRICRRLAASPHMERVFLVGDPYQSCYSFGGSDYRHFLAWDAVESIMPRSYRCPKPIMDLGERCLRQMRRGYRDRGILPASHTGSIRRMGEVEEAVSRVDPGKSTLILGRCGFVLEEYEQCLKRRGIPFTWVDRVGSVATLSGYQCLWDLEHGEVVSGDDWANAIAMIAVSTTAGKMLVHGEKKAWKEGRRSNIDFIRPTLEDLALAGCTETLAGLILSGQWASHLETKSVEKAAAWREAAVRFGPEIASNPKVRLSTIHSAKGLEGDTVILSTRSSPSVERARENLTESHDEECRVNYVAVTRARENLWIVDDGDRYCLEIPL